MKKSEGDESDDYSKKQIKQEKRDREILLNSSTARIQIKKGVTPKHKDQKDFKMTKSSYVQQDVEVGNVYVKEQKEMDM